ncbi:MAG: FecR domain-containing protein [Opitutales bacterium]
MTTSTDMTEQEAFEQELFELITRYEDDALNEAGLARLNELLIGSAKARDTFNDVCLQSLSISEALSFEETAIHQEVLQSKSARKLIPFPRWVSAVAAVFVALIATAYYFIQQDTPALDPAGDGSGGEILREPLMVRVQAKSGVVELLQADGSPIDDTEFSFLAPGATVSTRGPGSSTVLTYPDGTRIELGPDSFVSLIKADRKLVFLKRGQLRSNVQPQPIDKPFGVRTPHLELTVVGTEFLVIADDDDTSVRVLEGHVQVERLSDQGGVELVAGQEIVVAPDGELLVASLPPPSPESAEPIVDGSSAPRESNQPPIIDLSVGKGPIRGVVALGQRAVLRGRAVDMTGRPYSNAKVSLHANENAQEALAEATTDSQGRFELKTSVSGELVVRVGLTIETKVVATSGQVSELGDLVPGAK